MCGIYSLLSFVYLVVKLCIAKDLAVRTTSCMSRTLLANRHSEGDMFDSVSLFSFDCSACCNPCVQYVSISTY